MISTGITTLDVTGDAGSGRAIWLAQRIRPTDSVVDLGGTGQLLVSWHPHVTGFDDLSGFGPGHRIHAPRFVQGDVCDLSALRDDEFDIAVMTEVLEHVPLPWVALREARRVAPRVLITVPLEIRWRNAIQYRVAGHMRFFTLDLMALFLRRAGLDGELGILDFGPGWSFIVADVRRGA